MQDRAITVIAVVRSLHIHTKQGFSRWHWERRASFSGDSGVASKVMASHCKDVCNQAARKSYIIRQLDEHILRS